MIDRSIAAFHLRFGHFCSFFFIERVKNPSTVCFSSCFERSISMFSFLLLDLSIRVVMSTNLSIAIELEKE